MSELSELEELFQAVGEVSTRLSDMEEVLKGPRALDHSGLSIVASEGLRGGGTIDKSRPLALNVEGLRKQNFRLPDKEFLVFFSKEEGEHFKTDLLDLVNAVVKHSGFVESFIDVRRQIGELRAKLELFTVYERLYKAETLIAELKEKVDASEESQSAEAPKGREGREEGSS